MSSIIKVPGNKLTSKQVLAIKRMYISLHRDQLQYLKYLPLPLLEPHIRRGMKWFKKPDKLLLLYGKDNPIGMLAIAPNNTDKDSAYIGTLFVLPLHRDKGIATKLLSTALSLAKKKGLKAIVLGYYAANRASNLYNRFGYKPYLVRAIKELDKTAATSISFPLLLIPLLKSRLLVLLPIWTTRVSKLFGKYKKGDKLINLLVNLPLYVALSLNINNIDLHRFKLFLTPQQKLLLSKYKKMQLMCLVPYSWTSNPIYNRSYTRPVKKRINVARLLKIIADKQQLKPEKVNISAISGLNKKIDNVWGNGVFKQAPVLSVRQLALNHIPRILNADLSYPILINLNGTRIYDGIHRLIKAIVNKKKTIEAYKVPDSYIKLLHKTAADSLSMAARKHYLPGKWQHIKEVLRVARRFAGRSLTPVLRASILWHDSAKRDFGAEKHGLNGSKIALQLLPKFGYTPLQVKTIATAIRQHNLDLRIDNLNSFKQTIKRFASPLALLLALADDWRSPDILPVWRKTLSYNIKGKPTDRDAHDLYMHMTKRLSPMGRMPLLKYYGLKYKKSTDKFQKWLDALTLQLVADRIQRWKEANNL